METDPIVEKVWEEDSIRIGDSTEQVESNSIYVGKIFDNENESYDAYNSYVHKDLESVGVGSQSRIDQKVFWMQFVCTKKIIRIMIKGKRGMTWHLSGSIRQSGQSAKP